MIAVIGALSLSGFFLQRFMARSFHTTALVRAARTQAIAAIRDQLDEASEIRLHTRVQNSDALQRFAASRADMAKTLDALGNSIEDLRLQNVASGLTDARQTNATWLASIAEPSLHGNARSVDALTVGGDRLVDLFRSDVYRIDGGLYALVRNTDAGTATAIGRVGAFIVATVLAVTLFAVAFIVQQARFGERLELARVRSEELRLRTGELRASYEAEKRIADTLQEAFSQRPLPSLPTLRFSATYVPATEETNVGGDWYDALELPQGRVLFAIGDVAGHGIEAAVTMNRARQSLISCALLDPEPASMLRRVNTELINEHSTMVTALAGYADSQTYEFVYASAGHPPPVLLEPNREPRLLEFGMLPLGVSADAAYRTYRVQSEPGAMLVLYTDGALEHSRNVIEGEELLLAATAEAGERMAEDSATVIHNAIFSGRAVGDDVAILTIGFSTNTASGSQTSVDSERADSASRTERPEPLAPPIALRDYLFRKAVAMPKELAS